MNNATITKSNMDCYSIRANGEWALICMKGWKRDDITDRHLYAGNILIYSSFGSYNNQWNACGLPFREFLLDLDFGYFMDKTRGLEATEFDLQGTIKPIKREIIQDRRRRVLSMEEARTLLDHLDLIDPYISRDMFVSEMMSIPEDDDPDGRLRIEPWHYCRDRYAPETVGFWREIWPVFCAELRREIEETYDRAAYDQYVDACHSIPGQFVSELLFKEWIAAGKPSGVSA